MSDASNTIGTGHMKQPGLMFVYKQRRDFNMLADYRAGLKSQTGASYIIG